VASTTSTQDSGLFGYILPIFTAKTGISVKVIALETALAAAAHAHRGQLGARLDRRPATSRLRALARLDGPEPGWATAPTRDRPA
jgi:hypothetical protein